MSTSDQNKSDLVTSGAALGRAFGDRVRVALDHVTATQGPAIARAADLIVAALRRDGVVQAFGTGHSEAMSMEIVGRAGGLIATNKIALRDLVVLGGADPSVLADATGLERDPSIAARLYELAAPQPQDVFILSSNSGVNESIIEFALLVKNHGHTLIAVTSLEHTRGVPPRHPSGKRLSDLAEVVIDNAAPLGDAAVPLPGGGAVGAISSITGAFIAEQMIVTAVGKLIAEGDRPPVYLSSNVPGGHEHNQRLEAPYASRIRRMA